MSKFKVGDKVFDLRYGVGEVVNTELFQHFQLKVDFKSDNHAYTKVGNWGLQDSNPQLWTLQEAKDRGYGDQLPKEPYRWEGKVRFLIDREPAGTVIVDAYTGQPIVSFPLNTKGTLTFVEDVK